jgi:hypothetical protein
MCILQRIKREKEEKVRKMQIQAQNFRMMLACFEVILFSPWQSLS